MAAPTSMLVRIKPSNARESHTAHGVMITKAGGWYEVPASTARKLERERMNVLNPDASPPVFDVKTPDQAQEIVHAENVIADPAGTVDRPRVLAPSAASAGGASRGKKHRDGEGA